MSENFWKRLSNIFGLLAVAAVFGLAYFSAHLEIKDLDIWLHIGTGRYIATHGFHIPTHDVLSCTIAGNPWNNHEWLFQLIVYFLYQQGGFAAITQMQVVLVMATLAILFLLGYNPEKQLSSILILLLTCLVYYSRFTTRPDLFSLFFFAVYIWTLSYFLPRRWSLWVLFLVQALWVNIHGFFFLGPLFVLIALVSEWVKRHVPLPWEWNTIGRLEDAEYRRLKWIFLAVILACFFNPQFVNGAVYPLKILTQISGESRIFFENIIELHKPITWATIFNSDQYPVYKLLIILSFMAFFYNRRKIDISGLFFWLVFLLFSLAAVRNTSFFAFAAYLTFVTNAMTLTWQDILPLQLNDKKFLYILGITAKMFVIFWAVQTGLDLSSNGYYDLDTYNFKSEYSGVSLRSFPYHAVDFLVDNKIKGNFFNDFNSGAYLVGRCSPNIKVFIDGRTEVYGPRFFRTYNQMWKGAEGLAEALEKYHLTGAFLHSTRAPIPEETLRFFDKQTDWAPVYFDDDAVIYLKKVPANQAIIDRYRIDWSKVKPRKTDLRKIGTRKIPIFPYIIRMTTLKTLGLDDAALAELEMACRVNAGAGEIYRYRGDIYSKRKDYEKAFENYRMAIILSGSDETLRFNLALAYFDLGEYGYAAEQYQKIISLWPDNPRGYFHFARTRIRQKEYAKAVNLIRQGLALNPSAVRDALDMGDMVFADKEYGYAKTIYDLASGKSSLQDQVHLKLGLAAWRQGNKTLAKEEFEKGLTIKPQSNELLSNMAAVNAE